MVSHGTAALVPSGTHCLCSRTLPQDICAPRPERKLGFSSGGTIDSNVVSSPARGIPPRTTEIQHTVTTTVDIEQDLIQRLLEHSIITFFSVRLPSVFIL